MRPLDLTQLDTGSGMAWNSPEFSGTRFLENGSHREVEVIFPESTSFAVEEGPACDSLGRPDASDHAVNKSRPSKYIHAKLEESIQKFFQILAEGYVPKKQHERWDGNLSRSYLTGYLMYTVEYLFRSISSYRRWIVL